MASIWPTTPLPTVSSANQRRGEAEAICNRYERHATVITSNRDFNEWPLVFANPLMASATMDRLVHRAVKIVIEGKSFRMDRFVRRSRNYRSPRRTAMRPNRSGAGRCSRYHLPGGGALQAVLARFFFRHRAEVCPEARRPGDIGIPGRPSLSASDSRAVPAWSVSGVASRLESDGAEYPKGGQG